ncbi:MAG: biopolymer transporter ExbD [Deltaproteobacteria bacterium]|nr:MAG: biopolymer transporter ExbD [Deltaproteobacteria bacterium]
MRYVRRREQETGIDISPLIDMVFILLIFFMVSTTFVKDMKVDIERPGASSAERASTKAIRVTIDQAGAIYLDGVPVKPWMVQSRVRDLIRGGASKQMLVVTDRRVPVERVIEVVDQLRLAGAENVGVATEKEAG